MKPRFSFIVFVWYKRLPELLEENCELFNQTLQNISLASIHVTCHVTLRRPYLFNPILTGLFRASFNWGRPGVNPPSDLGPKGADRREILHGC